jgi:endoglucanase
MKTKTNELFQRLSNAHGVSGSEGSIRKIMEEELNPYVDSIITDKMGNLIATKKGTGPTIMLAAHMDEIGLMIKNIDDNGFLQFVKIGGWFDPTLHSQRVIVHTKNRLLTGVIGAKPPHFMEDEERKAPIKADAMFIDIGAKDKEDAEKLGVEVGSTVTLDRQFAELANGKVTGKAFDNRVGVAMLIDVMKQLSEMNVKATVCAVGTVQEEVGLKGARTSAFRLNPDVALAIDTTIPGDHPGIEAKDSVLEIGKGPVITIVDGGGRGLMVAPSVINWLKTTAIHHNIPYQVDVSDGGTTDATSIHLTHDGIPTGVIGISTRYIHSPVEVLDLKDLEEGTRLIVEAVRTAYVYF